MYSWRRWRLSDGGRRQMERSRTCEVSLSIRRPVMSASCAQRSSPPLGRATRVARAVTSTVGGVGQGAGWTEHDRCPEPVDSDPGHLYLRLGIPNGPGWTALAIDPARLLPIRARRATTCAPSFSLDSKGALP